MYKHSTNTYTPHSTIHTINRRVHMHLVDSLDLTALLLPHVPLFPMPHPCPHPHFQPYVYLILIHVHLCPSPPPPLALLGPLLHLPAPLPQVCLAGGASSSELESYPWLLVPHSRLPEYIIIEWKLEMLLNPVHDCTYFCCSHASIIQNSNVLLQK